MEGDYSGDLGKDGKMTLKLCGWCGLDSNGSG